MSDVVKIKVVQPDIRIVLNSGIPGPPPTDAQIIAALASLPEYPNDTEARADGLITNNLYWFSEDTDTGIYNTLKRVSPI